MKKTHTQRLIDKGGIIFSLVLLLNPYIKTFDILPDFFAYFILARALFDISFKAPYFEETRSSLIRLGFLSLARLAAVFFMSILKQNSSAINDTVTLVILVFSILEILFAVNAVKSFYAALEYLSERTSAVNLLSSYKTGKRTKSDLKALRDTAYIFILVKALGNLIPEMLLLYRDPLSGKFNPGFLYPYFFLAFFAVIILTSVIFGRLTLKYFKFVKNETVGVAAAADELMTPQKLHEIARRRELKNKKSALIIMTVAAFLNFEISLAEFRQINLLPTIVFALLMTYGFFKLTAGTGKYTLQKIASAVFMAAAVLKTAFEINFLINYEYSDFLTSGEAVGAYRLVMIMAAIELAATVFYMISFALSMSSYTDLSLRSSSLGAPDRTEFEYKRSFRRRAWVFSLFGMLTGLVKCIGVIINSTINSEFVNTSDTDVSVVFYSDAPWFSLLIAFMAIVFGFYAVHYLGAIKDDTELKYSEIANL